jgi:hypothetical protein
MFAQSMPHKRAALRASFSRSVISRQLRVRPYWSQAQPWTVDRSSPWAIPSRARAMTATLAARVRPSVRSAVTSVGVSAASALDLSL